RGSGAIEAFQGTSPTSEHSYSAAIEILSDLMLKKKILEVAIDGKKYSMSQVLDKLINSEWGTTVRENYPELKTASQDLRDKAIQLETIKIIAWQHKQIPIPELEEMPVGFKGTKEDFIKQQQLKGLLLRMSPLPGGNTEQLAEWGIISQETFLLSYP